MRYLLLIGLLFIPLCLYAPVENNKDVILTYRYEYQPNNKQDSLVFAFMQYDYLFEIYGITPELAITQAVSEQGWLIRENYRIFNLMQTTPTQNVEIVYDAYTKKKRSHRTYDCIEDAIVDYCLFINQYERYSKVLATKDPVEQMYHMAYSGYAEASHYAVLLNEVYFSYTKTIINHVRESKQYFTRNRGDVRGTVQQL